MKLTDGKLNSRHSGLLKPDYSEKSQSRRTSGESGSSAEVKVDVTAAFGLQVKNPSKKPKSVGSLEVFSDSAVGALPAIWAKLPQSLVLEGEKKGWRKITQRSKCFLLKKEPKQRKYKKRTSEKMIVFDHLTAHNPTVLNNELNWSNTDWAKEAGEIKSLLANKSKQQM